MARSRNAESSLTKLFDRSDRPIYVVDGHRRIVYCNLAMEKWFGLDAMQIVGSYVEYHSEELATHDKPHGSVRTLTGLCPPPAALGGEQLTGTASCLAQDDRLIHRRADFVPLAGSSSGSSLSGSRGVIVLLSQRDLTPQELEAELGAKPSADELHRAIRRFRRNQGASYAIESFLGESLPIRKIRAQVKAAGSSGAHVVIVGRPGTGRSRLAKTIHYYATADVTSALVPVDCDMLTEDSWRRAVESVRRQSQADRPKATLLLTNIEALASLYQSQLAELLRTNAIRARVISTLTEPNRQHSSPAGDEQPRNAADPRRSFAQIDNWLSTSIAAPLLAELSTITIYLPRLVDRIEDLPILAQCFLESFNCGSDPQIGSIHPDALDLLALHGWPGELVELKDVIGAAHRTATLPQIMPSDLPSVVHHATNAASFPPRLAPEPIVLDELLQSIEKEVIVRAMTEAKGNKTEAAGLLGMTRPRLYRRLVHFGLVSAVATDTSTEEIVFEPEGPEVEP